MEEIDDETKVSRTESFERTEPSVVFKIAWFHVSSKPGVVLKEYSEAESKLFKGKALFDVDLDDERMAVRIWVEEAHRSIEVAAWGDDEGALGEYLDEILKNIETSAEKYLKLNKDDQQRIRRALIAKTCWDRVVYEILSKANANDVYIQVAHGREMMIKATEGLDFDPITLTTSAWLTKIEPLPRDEPLPVDLAKELAKKTVAWKKDTAHLICQYI
ncbi:MAG: hypothetical protein PVG65_05695 [Candidatus Thorarchaeota archaeon]